MDAEQLGRRPFGILPFIAGTIAVMVVAAVIATPLSVGLALFMSEVAPDMGPPHRATRDGGLCRHPQRGLWLAGITVLVPFLQQYLPRHRVQPWLFALRRGVVLALMILPTITSISYDVSARFPAECGARPWPWNDAVAGDPARPHPGRREGIMTAVVLGMMRAAGEALAVQMVIGNRPVIPTGLTEPMTTLTSQITLDMGNTCRASRGTRCSGRWAWCCSACR